MSLDATSEHTTDRAGLTRWLIGHTRRLVPPLVGAVLARIANQLLGIALLVTATSALLRAAAGEHVDLPGLLLRLVLIALAKALLRYTEHYAGHWVAFTALQRLRELLIDRLIPQAPAATQGRAGAELTERATRDIDRIESFFAHTFPPAVAAVAVPAIALTWLATTVDALLAAVLAPFVLLALAVPLAARSATWRAAHRVAAARGAIAAQVGDDVQGARDVLALEAGPTRLADLAAADRELTSARMASARIQAIRAGLNVLIPMTGLLALVAVGSTRTSPEALAVALTVGVGLWAPTRGLEDFATGMDGAFAAAERVRSITEAEPAVREPRTPGPAPADSGVELRGVTLRYPGTAAPALDGVTARFAPGRWSYVVGVSGSGKSTLASLLLRGRDPDAGEVLLGGADVRGIGLEELRSRVGFVSQRPTLLQGTIAENLRLAAPAATDLELREALTTTALTEWVDSLPRGLDTQLRERGVSVSGGQLQRLALARTLLADPEVLVLDEALSQLDAASAAVVRERLGDRGLTVVEVTHRADLVPADGVVVVMDGGHAVEEGTAGELRAAGGAFTRLEARV